MIDISKKELMKFFKENIKKKAFHDKSTKQIIPDDKYDTAYNRRWLLQCAMQGDLQTIQEMIEKGITPNYQDREGTSVLQVAIDTCNIELIRIIAKSTKLNPNPIMKDTGITPLIAACKYIKNQQERLNICKLLLKIPEIDTNIQDRDGFTALCYAALFGDLQLVQALIDQRADTQLGPEIDHKIHGPLYYAKQCQYMEVVTFLEARGVSESSLPVPIKKNLPVPRVSRVHSKPPKPIRESPLQPPSFTKDGRGLRPKSEAQMYASFLDRTANKSKSMLVKQKPEDTILEAEEENIDDNKKMLIEAIHKEDNIRLTQLVLAGVDTNFKDESGQTPLVIAVEKTNPELVKTLLRSQTINVNLPDELGSYPIIAACRNKGPARLEILKMLLNHPSIDINAQDNEGHSALIFASIFGDLEITQLLISSGADINLGNEGVDYIETPLYHAKRNKHNTLVTLLESHGGEDGEPIIRGENVIEADNLVTPARAVPINVVTIPKIEIPEDIKGDTKWNRSLLLLKARNLELSAAQKLIEKGVDPNFVDEEGMTALLVAIEKRNIGLIKLFLSSPRLIINLRDENTGETPLLVASKLQGGNKIELIKVLLQGEGIHINSQDNDGRTPLYIAANMGDQELCKVLIDHGADLKLPKKDTSGQLETPLDAARRNNHSNIITLLQSSLQKNPPKNITRTNTSNVTNSPKKEEEPSKADTKFNRSKLLIDAKKGDIKSVRNLLEQGVNPNFVDENGESALTVAITKKDKNLMKLLCSNTKIDPTMCDPYFGSPPIFIALKLPSSPDRLEIIKLLLQTPGIDIQMTSEDGLTPLAISQQSGDSEVVKLLTEFVTPVKHIENQTDNLAKPANIVRSVTRQPPPPKKTAPPTRIATLQSAPKVAKTDARGPQFRPPEKIVVNPQPKSADTKWNRSLLLLHAKKGDNKTVKKLLEKGVSPNFVDEEGESPLSAIIVNGNLAGFQILLAHPTLDVNLSDEMSGVTPLMCAAQIKGPQRLEIIKHLLQKEGVNINAQDEEGRTALLIATRSGDIEVAKLLIESSADVNVGRSSDETPLQYAIASNNKELIALFQPRGENKEAPKPFETVRERFLTQTLTVLRETSKHNVFEEQPQQSQQSQQSQQPQQPQQPQQQPSITPEKKLVKFSEKVFVRVPIRDPVKDVIIGRGWKRYLFVSDVNNTLLQCFDINTNLEVPELKIVFAKVKSVEKRDMYNEPNKFAFMIIPLKLHLAASTEKGRDIWMQIIMHYCKELRPSIRGVSESKPMYPSRTRLVGGQTEDTEDNRAILFQKVSSGDIKGATQLIQKRVNPNFIHNGKTCLIVALENSNIPMVELLLTSPLIDVNMPESDRGLTPVHTALKRPNKFQLTQLLLASPGINVNIMDKNERSPLIYAIVQGEVDLSRILIESKADVNLGRKVGDKIETPLHIATKNNNKKLIQLLLSNGADSTDIRPESVSDSPIDDKSPNLIRRSPFSRTRPQPQQLVSEATTLGFLDPKQLEILKCIKEENYKLLLDLVHKQFIDPNFHDEQGKTPLILSIEKSDRNFVRIFLKRVTTNINMPDSTGHTPLIRSIISNRGPERNRIIVHLIQGDGCNVNLSDKESRTPLVHAVLQGDLDACRILIKAGADVNIGKKTKERIETPLYHALLANFTHIASFLESQGGSEISFLGDSQGSNNDRASTEYNKKLLLLSVKKADLYAVADLIKKGVDPNYIDRTSGQTALQIAIETQNVSLLRLLLKSPLIDPNIRFSDVMCTPLIYASKQKNGPRLEIVRVLLQPTLNIDVNAIDKNGRTALTYASFFGDYDLVKVLIDANANVNPVLENPNLINRPVSPLVYAKRYNHHKVVTLLMQYGAQDDDIGTTQSPSKSSGVFKSSTAHLSQSAPTGEFYIGPTMVDRGSMSGTLLSPRSLKYRTSPMPKPRVGSPQTTEPVNNHKDTSLNPIRTVSHTIHMNDSDN